MRVSASSRSLITMLCLMAALLLSACGGSSGGDVTATATQPETGDVTFTREPATFRVDGDTGSDSHSIALAMVGGGGPWQSIQHALDQARPGDTIQVLRAEQPYSGARSASVVDPAGIILNTSGEAGLSITLEGVPDAQGRRPVIDQGRTVPDDVAPVAGLLLNCVSHVTVRGFEIRHANDAGITTSLSGCEHQGLAIEDNIVYEITGVGYVAGIRLVQTRNSLVRGNRLHGITVSPTLTVDDPPRLVNSTVPTENNRIEHNDIGNLAVAVHIRGRGAQPLSVHSVEKNRIHNVETGLLLTADTARPAAINNTTFTGNLVYDVDLASDEGHAVDVQLGLSGIQSSGLNIALNTLVNIDQPLRLAGMADVRILENILTSADSDLLLSIAPQTPDIVNRFAFIDNNLYFGNAATSWTLASGGAPETRFLSLPAWRQAFSAITHPELLADPDLLSLETDPLFIDPTQADFSLLIDSPATTLGSNGGQIGAYFDGDEPGVR